MEGYRMRYLCYGCGRLTTKTVHGPPPKEIKCPHCYHKAVRFGKGRTSYA